MVLRQTSPTLRLVTWTARAVIALSITAWCLSLWQLTWESRRFGDTFYLSQGALTHVNATFGNPGLRSRGLDWPTQWWWSIDSYALALFPPTAPITYTKVPLWMPAAAAGATTLIVRHLVRRQRRRAGLCTACAYDLTGITGPCPECGQACERDS